MPLRRLSCEEISKDPLASASLAACSAHPSCVLEMLLAVLYPRPQILKASHADLLLFILGLLWPKGGEIKLLL